MTSAGTDHTAEKPNAESMTITKYIYVQTTVHTIENFVFVLTGDELYRSNRAISKKCVEQQERSDEK